MRVASLFSPSSPSPRPRAAVGRGATGAVDGGGAQDVDLMPGTLPAPDDEPRPPPRLLKLPPPRPPLPRPPPLVGPPNTEPAAEGGGRGGAKEGGGGGAKPPAGGGPNAGAGSLPWKAESVLGRSKVLPPAGLPPRMAFRSLPA